MKWAYIENVALIVVAGGLAYAWDSAWPFLLLLWSNIPKSRGGSDD